MAVPQKRVPAEPVASAECFELFPDPAHPRPAGDPPRIARSPEPAYGRILSVALAMKGGVSLAVWIGGAVCEIDVVRRIRIERDGAELRARFVPDHALLQPELGYVLRRADLYAGMLMSRGYDRVEFDVLAGASAGGLNSILYGVAQRAGVGVDGLMEVWAESGSAWNLLQRRISPTLPSVLSADYFWDQVRTAISTFYQQVGTVEHVTPELTVDLSATITDVEYRTMPGARDPRAHFHFVGVDPDAPQDAIVPPGQPETSGRARSEGRGIPSFAQYSDEQVNRLGYAARTTSSFPGAFEQARIWSPSADRRGRLVGGTPSGFDSAVNMTFAFSAHREGEANSAMPIRVMDGGVLDNIPIDRMMRAIRDRTPSSHGDRIAIYLDPSPDDFDAVPLRPEPSDPPRPDARRDHRGKQSFLATVRGGLSLRGIRESEADETDQLEAEIADAIVSRDRAMAYATLLSTGGARLAATPSDLVDGYRGLRAETDALLVGRTLENPDLWQLTTDLASRSRWRPTEPERIRELPEAFINPYTVAHPEPPLITAIVRGSQGLRDAALCALDWMRAIEERTYRATPEQRASTDAERSALRADLHRISVQARQLRDQNLRDLLDQFRSEGTVAAWSASDVVTDWIARELLTTQLPTRPGAALWTELDGLLPRLSTLWAGVADVAGPPVVWARFPASWSATSLAPFVAPAGVPDPFQLEQYNKITAADATGMDAAFTPLVVAQRSAVIEQWLRLPSDRFVQEAVPANLPSHLDPSAKLAGSILGNFGAFFSRAWRNNDWWWGRLDAAAGVVDTLALLPPSGGPDSAAAREAVQRLTLLQLNSWTPHATIPVPARLAAGVDDRRIDAP